MYGVVLPLIRLLHFWSPVVSSGQRSHWLPVAPSNREPLNCLSVLCVCVCVCLIFKRWNSVTILNQGCLSCLKNRRELSGCRSRPQIRLEKSRYQGNHWIHLSFTRFERKLAVLSMHHYGILYPLALNVYWWGGWELGAGGTEQWKLYACQLCFTKQLMGLNFISIIYSMCGSSWTHGIGTLKRFLSKQDVH